MKRLNTLEEANHCDECKRIKAKTNSLHHIEAASHSTTDAKQTPEGAWEETAPRYGCRFHKALPMVILLDGTVIPFSEYHVN